jgi:hypothetical protein
MKYLLIIGAAFAQDYPINVWTDGDVLCMAAYNYYMEKGAKNQITDLDEGYLAEVRARLERKLPDPNARAAAVEEGVKLFRVNPEANVADTTLDAMDFAMFGCGLDAD